MSGTSLQYDTAKLVATVPNLKRPSNFLLDRFFSNEVTSDTEYVAIDVDIGKRRMAPFCSPLVEGKLQEQRRFQTNTFKPPYIKDKRAPDLRKPVRRMIGEAIGGTMTGADREMANLEAELTDQVDNIDRRLEWMAANALATASYTVSGDGFPTTLIDFGRDSTLTVALTGSNKWGTTGNLDQAGRDPRPARDIEAWQHQMLKKSGAVGTDLIFTTTPWTYFINAVGVQGAVYMPKMSDAGNMLNPGAEIQRGGVFKGIWGQYRCWLYNDWYVDANDVEQPMLADGTVILSGPDLQGIRAFAQIMDPEFAYTAMPYAPKTWVQKDPAQRLVMMQSAPIVIPSRVNACFAATVCDAILS